MIDSSCAIVQIFFTLSALSVYGPWPLIIPFGIYCILALPIAMTGPYSLRLKPFLVNILGSAPAVASKLRPTIVTRKFVWYAVFVLSANCTWTIFVVPKTMPFWELCIYMPCSVVIAIYPLLYAMLAMREGSTVGLTNRGPIHKGGRKKSFGTTKHGVLFLPTYRTIMIFGYCIWNILFVIYYNGNISALYHSVMSIVVAVIFVLAEGKKLSDTALFWGVSRSLTLACWIATSTLYENVPLLKCNISTRYHKVNVDGVAVDILVLAMLAVTIFGVIDLAWFYMNETVTNNGEDLHRR